jgi:hypothetical protein
VKFASMVAELRVHDAKEREHLDAGPATPSKPESCVLALGYGEERMMA